MNRTNQFSLSILCFFICFLLAMSGIRARDEALAADIAPKILRFHVLANSDSRTDQAVKMEVRDAVLSYLKEVLPEGLDVKETTRWMRGHTEKIRQVAEQKMADLQMKQTVSVAVTTCYFPDRTYGDVTFPAGNYKTLRIELGDAAGHNWWCVLYPNLCFLDTTKGKAAVKESIDGGRIFGSDGRFKVSDPLVLLEGKINMTEFLIRHFVKDYEEVEKVSVRTAYGMLSGIVGIFCNVILFLTKLIVGLVLNSVSVMADAFNNLSDAGSSVISFVGVRMAGKPADKDHPFGHGRIEYIAALIVSFLVLEVGFTFLKDSVGKILHPEQLKFLPVSVLILCLSIAVKLWLGLFNKKLGERIDSQVMKAVFADSMGDVITTSATIFSILFFAATGINIDGFVGLGVALVVMWAGFGIAKDTLNTLIGEPVSPEVYEKIKKFVEGYDGIEGVHDLIVHNYGPGRSMASIHAEVPNDQEIEKSHETIDRVERDAAKELGMMLVIHMDPVEMKDEKVIRIRKKTEQLLKELDPACSIHDFRVVWGAERINLIFDMVIPIEYDEKRRNDLPLQLMERLKGVDSRYESVITVDYDYVAKTEDK